VIEIAKPGTLTTIQDAGRTGYQELGVPESGALDNFAFRCANLLVGNAENTPALESVLFGPEIKFLDDTFIAITGADLGPVLNGNKVNLWETLEVSSGSILTFSGPTGNGLRSYLALAGGVAGAGTELVMGSYSTYLAGKFGGHEGRALRDGDVIATGTGLEGFEGGLSLENPPNYDENEVIRIIEGPQHDRFSETAMQTLTSSSYQVTSNSDRMGCRLDGPILEHLTGPDVISDGNAFGVIQVPGDGKPIILLADRGTTGGYTKIATVITADRSKLAQLLPGSTIRFEIVDQPKAVEFLREQERLLASFLNKEGSPLKFKVDGMLVDVVDDCGRLLSVQNPETKTYAAKVSYEVSEHQVEVEISE